MNNNPTTPRRALPSVAKAVAAALIAAAALVAPVAAQEHQHPAGRTPATSPYADLTSREIKALSPEQIAQYLNGEGMSLALAAELNHYPGPRHALDLADELGLSAEQRRAVTAIRDSMRAAAIRHGQTIVAREQELDRAFATGSITPERLRRLTAEIGRLQGELRATHLAAHIVVKRLLSPEQVSRYDALRGYGSGDSHRH